MEFCNCSATIVFALTALMLMLSAEAANFHGGFTVDLIHRDSPKSPLYNPSHSPYELMKRAYQRSSKRKEIFSSTTSIVPNDGEYLVEISFGTPPFKTFAIADSGSDLSWTQCQPCLHCFQQETSPIFNPENSSSFESVPCTSKTCTNFFGYCERIETKINNADGTNRTNSTPCTYDMAYGDGSTSHGILATETITFGSDDGERPASSFREFVFGCGHDNEGSFPNKSSGVFGLGFGNQSILTQLNSSINGKFSYCLGPFTEPNKSGKLSFGKEAEVSGHGVVSTPLILDVYYSLILEGVSVGTERLSYNYTSPPRKPLKGNIIIDSGTTTTYLPEELYKQLESKVRSKIKSANSVADPLGFFTSCYQGLNDADIPILTFHFKGADLELKPPNTFVATSDTVKCLCFTSSGLSGSGIPIFGNIAQNNLWVGYDLQKKTVSFIHSDCSKL